MAGTLVEDESENVELVTFMLSGALALLLGVSRESSQHFEAMF
jgi:hypothetical protein